MEDKIKSDSCNHPSRFQDIQILYLYDVISGNSHWHRSQTIHILLLNFEQQDTWYVIWINYNVGDLKESQEASGSFSNDHALFITGWGEDRDINILEDIYTKCILVSHYFFIHYLVNDNYFPVKENNYSLTLSPMFKRRLEFFPPS